MHAGKAALLAMCVASCAESRESGVNVSIAPESRADSVVFELESSPLMYGLSVLPCGKDRAVWVIGHEGPGVPPPRRIVYGESPPGYVERAPAQPLRPGCYRVVVSGPRSTEFVVNADGTVSDRSRGRAGAPTVAKTSRP